jgi:aminoglycoside phosphotransferase family enzyme/predicted kinase
VVVCIGDRAYKLLKPVDLGFLDHRERAARERACRLEVEANRRFAPDVYLGVLDVVDEAGEPRDHLVAMRRLPAARRLSSLLSAPDAAERVREVGRAIAAVHADAPRSARIGRAGLPDEVRANWRAGIDALGRVAPDLLPEEEVARAGELARGYLDGREPLLRQRIEEGWVRDGHGDLLADDVYCLADGPRLLDCLAFDERLRHGDVLADVAFLAMDLEARDRPELAELLVREWAEALGEAHPASLAHHYIAYRAHVRAKVACLRAEQGDRGASSVARRLHALAVGHLERARVRLVLVGGLPGTGKSTVAAALADRTGWRVLRSDEERLRLLGPPRRAGAAPIYGAGRYADEHRDRVYAALLADAVQEMVHGQSVVLDASWGSDVHREAARLAARAARADVVELRCDAPPAVTERRILARRATGVDPSEATPEIVGRMAAEADPWPEARRLPTDGALDDTVEAALPLVGPA